MSPDPLLPESSDSSVRRTYTADQMREYGRARERAAYERARHIVRTYKVPVGNSAAGEMACEWTMDALREIDDAIAALGADK